MGNGTALLVIDVQNGMFMEEYPLHDSDGLLERISSLITKAREKNIPVIYVQHNEGEGEPLETNSEGWNIHPRIAPIDGDLIIQKHVPDSFHETNLQTELKSLGIDNVILTGLQTDYCVHATSRRASELNYQVTVVKDCHSTFSIGNESAEEIIARYNDQFRAFANLVESSNIEF
ncbi:cysteine hydrolase family protein [Paenibacillus thermotolerans]|uniref:cysteine hydrolase family protein n=1 Tax=Paenibacillus thermotolerans TaxID=3027807 RepID=UPI0023683B8E|nr:MULTISPECIES: cysteine hydrolase family protein [unclassified Paenibacillus]